MTRPITQIGLAVKRLQNRQLRNGDAALAPLGLSVVQWDALRHIAENPGASLHDLAVLTFQSDQAFGALANRMVERGLIERVPGPGRAVRHRLSERGERLHTDGRLIFEKVLTESFSALTAEQLATFDQLLGLLLPPARP